MATNAATIVDGGQGAAPVEPTHEEQLGAMYPDDRDGGEPNADPNPDDGQQVEDDEQQVDEPQLDPIAAPHSWSAEDKEKFAALPREAQEIVARRETERDRMVNQKAQEAAQARQQATQEARQAVQQIYENHVAAIQQYSQMFNVQPPDIRLLQSGDPQHHALYNEQDRQYRIATAQQHQLQQEAEQARQQAEALQQQSLRDHAEREFALLSERLPEWSDPSSRAKLLSDLQPIGQELGYSPEQMSQAGATDILALKLASEWKRKADKLDAMNKAKMVPVRAAKDIPPAARSGTSGQGQQPNRDIAATLYPNDVRR